MPTLADVRDGFVNRLETIDELNVYRHLPETVVTPAAVLRGPTSVVHDLVSGLTLATYRFEVVVLVPRAQDTAGFEALDRFVVHRGPASVRQAIHADTSLSGAVSDLFVPEVSDGMEEFTVGDTPYWGATWQVDVHMEITG